MLIDNLFQSGFKKKSRTNNKERTNYDNVYRPVWLSIIVIIEALFFYVRSKIAKCF